MTDSPREKPIVFISHIGEEAELAALIKARITEDFLGMVDVFVSSDKESIAAGERWLEQIDHNLTNAKVELVLCSHESIRRPWVNFEAGAGWVKKIPIIPVCHTGMRPTDLPIPLNLLQAIEACSADGWRRVYAQLASQLGSREPTADFASVINRIKEFERLYGIVRRVVPHVKAIMKVIPELEVLFRPGSLQRAGSGPVWDYMANDLRPHLEALQAEGMLTYRINNYMTMFTMSQSGEPGGGGRYQLSIQLRDEYYAIAADVMRLQ